MKKRSANVIQSVVRACGYFSPPSKERSNSVSVFNSRFSAGGQLHNFAITQTRAQFFIIMNMQPFEDSGVTSFPLQILLGFTCLGTVKVGQPSAWADQNLHNLFAGPVPIAPNPIGLGPSRIGLTRSRPPFAPHYRASSARPLYRVQCRHSLLVVELGGTEISRSCATPSFGGSPVANFYLVRFNDN